jgi:hypothetical protein
VLALTPILQFQKLLQLEYKFNFLRKKKRTKLFKTQVLGKVIDPFIETIVATQKILDLRIRGKKLQFLELGVYTLW